MAIPSSSPLVPAGGLSITGPRAPVTSPAPSRRRPRRRWPSACWPRCPSRWWSTTATRPSRPAAPSPTPPTPASAHPSEGARVGTGTVPPPYPAGDTGTAPVPAWCRAPRRAAQGWTGPQRALPAAGGPCPWPIPAPSPCARCPRGPLWSVLVCRCDAVSGLHDEPVLGAREAPANKATCPFPAPRAPWGTGPRGSAATSHEIPKHGHSTGRRDGLCRHSPLLPPSAQAPEHSPVPQRGVPRT